MFIRKDHRAVERRVVLRMDKQHAQELEQIRQSHAEELTRKDKSWGIILERAIKNERISARQKRKNLEQKMGRKIARMQSEVWDARTAWKMFKSKAIELEHQAESVSAFLELEAKARLDRYKKIEGNVDSLEPIVRFIQSRKGKKIEFKLGEIN